MKQIQPWWRLSMVLYVALLLSICLWQLTRPGGPDAVVWAFQLIPLAVFLPAIWRGNARGLVGLCFVLLLYFISAVEGVMGAKRAWIDWTVLCLSVTLFISAMLASRERQRPPHIPAPVPPQNNGQIDEHLP